MNNILVTVDEINVHIAKHEMVKCFTLAMNTGKGTCREIDAAEKMLEKARGIYDTLVILKLLSREEQLSGAIDIGRIEDKLEAIRREREAEVYARHMQRRS